MAVRGRTAGMRTSSHQQTEEQRITKCIYFDCLTARKLNKKRIFSRNYNFTLKILSFFIFFLFAIVSPRPRICWSFILTVKYKKNKRETFFISIPKITLNLTVNSSEASISAGKSTHWHCQRASISGRVRAEVCTALNSNYILIWYERKPINSISFHSYQFHSTVAHCWILLSLIEL